MESSLEPFDRSVATLVCLWAYLAAGSPGAEVIERGDAAIAAFVHSPDREFLNNAVLARGLAGLGESSMRSSAPTGTGASSDTPSGCTSQKRPSLARSRRGASNTTLRPERWRCRSLTSPRWTRLGSISPSPASMSSGASAGSTAWFRILTPREGISTSRASTASPRRC